MNLIWSLFGSFLIFALLLGSPVVSQHAGSKAFHRMKAERDRKLLQSDISEGSKYQGFDSNSNVCMSQADCQARHSRISRNPAAALVQGADTIGLTLDHMSQRARDQHQGRITRKKRLGTDVIRDRVAQLDTNELSSTSGNRRLLNSYTVPSELTLGISFVTSTEDAEIISVVNGALNKINSDSEILGSTTLRAQFDIVAQTSNLAASTTNLISNYSAVGLITKESDDALEMSPVALNYSKPVCSPSATASGLNYTNFYRTVPSDDYQASTIADMLFYYGWFSTLASPRAFCLASANSYGTDGCAALDSALSQYGIYLTTITLTQDANPVNYVQGQLETYISGLASCPGTLLEPCTVISFISTSYHTQNTILEAASLASTDGMLKDGYQFIFSDAYSVSDQTVTPLTRKQGVLYVTPETNWKNDLDFLTLYSAPSIDSAIMADVVNSSNICLTDSIYSGYISSSSYPSYSSISYDQYISCNLVYDTNSIFDSSFYSYAPGWWDIIYLYAFALDSIIQDQGDYTNGDTVQTYLSATTYLGAFGYHAFDSSNNPTTVHYALQNYQDGVEVSSGAWTSKLGWTLKSSASIYSHGGSIIAEPTEQRFPTSSLLNFVPIPANAVPPRERFGSCTVVAVDFMEIVVLHGTVSLWQDPYDDVWTYDLSTDRWSAVPSLGSEAPIARAYPDCALVGDFIYMFGGKSGSGMLDDMWRLKLSTKRWREISYATDSNPASRYQHCIFASDDESGLYLFGGQTSDSTTANNLWKFDVNTAKWSQESEFTLSTLTATAPICASRTKSSVQYLYFTSGFYQDTSTIYYYNTANQTWHSVSSTDSSGKPSQLGSTTRAIFMQDRMWFAHGWSETTYSSYKRIWSIDMDCPSGPYCGTWSTRAEYADTIDTRDSAGFVQIGSRLITFGGWGTSSIHNDLLVFDGVKFEAEEVHTDFASPPVRTSHQGSLIGNSYFMFGGLGSAGALADIWAFELVTETWASISASGTYPAARYDHCMTSLGPKAFIYGGQDGDVLYEDMFVYNAFSGSISQLTPASTQTPGKLKYHVCVSNSQTSFILHGGQDDVDAISSDIWEFDLISSSWSQITVSSNPQCSLSDYDYSELTRFGGEIIDNVFYRVGGWDSSLDPYASFFAFNLTTKCWSQLDDLGADGDLYGFSDLTVVKGGTLLYAYGGSYYELMSGALQAWDTSDPASGWQFIGESSRPSARAGAIGLYFGSVLYFYGGWGPEFDNFGLQTNYLSELWKLNLGPICDPSSACDSAYQCSAGTYYSSGSCVSCQTGRYNSEANQLTCSECALGYYNSFTGASSEALCIACGTGTFNNVSAASSCLSCNTGFECPVGSFSSLNGIWSDSSVQDYQPSPASSNDERQALLEDLITQIGSITIAVLAVIFSIVSCACSRHKPCCSRLDMIFDYSHHQATFTPIFRRKTACGGSIAILTLLTLGTVLGILAVPYLVNNRKETRSLVPLSLVWASTSIGTSSLSMKVTLFGYEGLTCVDDALNTALTSETTGTCSTGITYTSPFDSVDSEEVYCVYSPSPVVLTGVASTDIASIDTALDQNGGIINALSSNCSLVYKCVGCSFSSNIHTLETSFQSDSTKAQAFIWSVEADSGYPDQASTLEGIHYADAAHSQYLLGTETRSLVDVKATAVIHTDTDTNTESKGAILTYIDTTIGDTEEPPDVHGSNGVLVDVQITLTDSLLEVDVGDDQSTISITGDVLGVTVGIIALGAVCLRFCEWAENKIYPRSPGTSREQIDELVATVMNKNIFELASKSSGTADNLINFYFGEEEHSSGLPRSDPYKAQTKKTKTAMK